MAGLYRRWWLWRTMSRIKASGAFDRGWYLGRYPDVAAAGIDPLRHYVLSGYREGRLANPIFDSGWYLAHYFPDEADPPNPLVDYLLHVRRDTRRPNRWFDPAWYRREAGVPSWRDPMLHYLEAGIGARDPGPDFDLQALMGRCTALGRHTTPLGFFLNDYRVAGCLGDCTSYYVAGWASRQAGPEVDLTVLVNGREQGRVTPWIDRPDVRAALGLNAFGFYFVFPMRLRHEDVVELRDEFGQTLIGCATTYKVPPLGASADFYANRASIAATFLTGRGVEVGAFTQPNDLPPDRAIAFYDRYPTALLRQFYEDSEGRPLMEPDYVGDAQTLEGLPEGSFQFFIANHVLEHLEDPIAFLKRMVTKLTTGGRAMIAVPDMRFCADCARALTPFSHLLEDHERGPQHSRFGHFLESAHVDGFEGQAALDHARAIEVGTTLVHYHVWDAESFVAFIRTAIDHFSLPLMLLYSSATIHEVIVVLEKTTNAVEDR